MKSDEEYTNSFDIEEFKENINSLFNPEPDEDGVRFREYPTKRLMKKYGLNFDYMTTFDYEGSTIHKHTRCCSEDEKRIQILIKNMDVPVRLFSAALRLFADSIIEYYDNYEREGDIRYYPSIILTFWSGFETFVRYSSELLVLMTRGIPTEVIRYLREEEAIINNKSEIKIKTKYQPVLERYKVFLFYAYNYNIDKGAKYWQKLIEAKKIRDYYTHLDICDPREISSRKVLEYMEAIMMAIIYPSSYLERTILLGVYYLYEQLAYIWENNQEFVERPLFIDISENEKYNIHCNFKNIDEERFPRMIDI